MPRLAATVICYVVPASGSRCCSSRNPESRFMGGAWVFPGGAVDREDGAGDAALRAAAVRELAEEAGVGLRPSELVAFSQLDHARPGQDPVRHLVLPRRRCPTARSPRSTAGGRRCALVEPAPALAAAARGQICWCSRRSSTSSSCRGFASADELLEYARGRDVSPVSRE